MLAKVHPHQNNQAQQASESDGQWAVEKRPFNNPIITFAMMVW